MAPGQSSKRGHTLVSTGGITPEGTVIYLVQILNPDGRVAVVAYFFRDEFDNWAVFDKKGNVFTSWATAGPLTANRAFVRMPSR
jgi:hypothetical protein